MYVYIFIAESTGSYGSGSIDSILLLYMHLPNLLYVQTSSSIFCNKRPAFCHQCEISACTYEPLDKSALLNLIFNLWGFVIAGCASNYGVSHVDI